MPRGYRRHPAFESRLPATTGDVCVTVDQARYDAASLGIDLDETGASGVRLFFADRENPAAADQHMTDTEIFGGEDPGIGDEG